MPHNIITKFGINTGIQISDTEDPHYGNIKLQPVSYLSKANSLLADIYKEDQGLMSAVPVGDHFFYLVEQYNQLTGEKRILIASEMGMGLLIKENGNYYLQREIAQIQVQDEATFTGETANLLTFDHQQALRDGPYYVDATSSSGSSSGNSGYFYPLYLTQTSANAAVGATSSHVHTFTEYPGILFYMPDNHANHPGDEETAKTSGDNYATAQSYLIVTSVIPDDYRLLCSSANSVLCVTREQAPQPINLDKNTVLGRKSDNIQPIDLHELGDLLGSQFIVTALEGNTAPLVSSSSHFELSGSNSLIICKSVQLEPRVRRPSTKLPGSLIFNSKKSVFEGYDGQKWRPLKWGDE